MKILEQTRRNLFWSLDGLKGNKVGNHLEDIGSILNNFSSQWSQQRRAEILSKYLQHTVKTSPFYHRYKGYNDILDFPIITKMDIREHYDEMLSESYKELPSIEIATSGTTGIPFRIKQDLNKKNRNVADAFFFGNKGGYTIGDRLYYVRKWVPETSRTPLQLLLTNIEQINVTDFSQPFLDKLTSKMCNDKSNKALLGYSSALGDICSYMDAHEMPKARHGFKSIITMSEPLSIKTKKRLEHYFGCPVLARYSNSENGIFAQQRVETGEDYHINWASYFVEILQLDNDDPAPEGELGRIVVTDLFNYCMPMVRYDTGDLGILVRRDGQSAPVLSKIEGRRMDVLYSTKGQPLSPYVAFEMEYFTELKQFQLIQEGEKEYTAKLNLDGVFKNEEKLVKRLRKYLGKDAVINFEYVKDFPQLASGKRRLTVNNYKKVS